jgi:hypothetical protein
MDGFLLLTGTVDGFGKSRFVLQDARVQLREALDEELAYLSGANIADVAEEKRTSRIVDSNRTTNIRSGRKAPAAYVAPITAFDFGHVI